MGDLSWHMKTAFRAEALSTGRYDLLVDEYAYPLTVYLHGLPQVLRDRGEAWAFFQELHGTLRALGYARVTARVAAQDLPRAGRVRLWCDWYGEAPGGAATRFASTVCYARTDAGEPKTELLEFTRLDLPQAAAA